MNREFKFRAWDINKKIFMPVDVYCIITNDFNALGMMIKDWEDYREGEYLYSNSQIVMQYTGLKDKNGVEIYEGDIISGGISSNGVITFENGTFTIWGTPLGWDVEDYNYDEKPEILLPEKWAIVIGNIYENPDLLNPKKETL